MGSYKGLRESEARGPPIVNSIVAAARQCNLDRDIPELPNEDTDCKTLTLDERDNIVGACACLAWLLLVYVVLGERGERNQTTGRGTIHTTHKQYWGLTHPYIYQSTSTKKHTKTTGKVYQKIMEIESRLLPCGLHTVGVPPTAEEAIATLVNIASLDRPEEKIKVRLFPVCFV